LFDAICEACNRAERNGDDRVTFKIKDIAGYVKRHPKYDPPKHSWVNKVTGARSRDSKDE
jgi:hypothetical protein